MKSNCNLCLPKITEEIQEDYELTDLIDFDDEGNPQWSQIAVDFACLIRDRCNKAGNRRYQITYEIGDEHQNHTGPFTREFDNVDDAKRWQRSQLGHPFMYINVISEGEIE